MKIDPLLTTLQHILTILIKYLLSKVFVVFVQFINKNSLNFFSTCFYKSTKKLTISGSYDLKKIEKINLKLFATNLLRLTQLQNLRTLKYIKKISFEKYRIIFLIIRDT